MSAYDEGRSEALAGARRRVSSDAAAELQGFVGGALALGVAGNEGKGYIPDAIMGVDSDLVIGAAMYLYQRKKSGKMGARARGVMYAALAGGLKDQGAKLAQRF